MEPNSIEAYLAKQYLPEGLRVDKQATINSLAFFGLNLEEMKCDERLN